MYSHMSHVYNGRKFLTRFRLILFTHTYSQKNKIRRGKLFLIFVNYDAVES